MTASIPDNIIITITQAVIDDLSNESFVTNGLEVGSYVIVGQNIQDLKLRTLNMSDPSNVVYQDPDILLSDIFTDEATWQQFLTDNSLSYNGVYQSQPTETSPIYTFSTEEILIDPFLPLLGFKRKFDLH